MYGAPRELAACIYISLSTHTDFSGPWHVQAGLNAQGALCFSRLPASLNTLGGWLRTGGILCGTHCVMRASRIFPVRGEKRGRGKGKIRLVRCAAFVP